MKLMFFLVKNFMENVLFQHVYGKISLLAIFKIIFGKILILI